MADNAQRTNNNTEAIVPATAAANLSPLTPTNTPVTPERVARSRPTTSRVKFVIEKPVDNLSPVHASGATLASASTVSVFGSTLNTTSPSSTPQLVASQRNNRQPNRPKAQMATTAGSNDDDLANGARSSSVTIPLATSSSPNNDDDSPMNDTSARAPLTGNIKNMELYDEYQERPLSKFINNMINFNSLIPSNQELTDRRDNAASSSQKKPAQQNKLGTVLGVFLPCVQNIFGVILFIRASWIVGVAGSVQAFCIVLMCCTCTLLTAISTSAIATNGIVPAGGPYFMISRSLGPECGGAVGILFYLGNTVAASMYIVGAVEIFLKYMCPFATIVGNIEVQSDAFHNFRIYGTIFLIIIGFCVFIGIKFVSKLAPISLVAVLISVVCIYAGVIKSAFDPPHLDICVFNQTRLIRYDSYVIDEVPYCHNERYCMDKDNQTFTCPLWKAYCGPLYDDQSPKYANQSTKSAASSTSTIASTTPFIVAEMNEVERQKFRHLCHFFEQENSVTLRPGIPGISSSKPISENYKSTYLSEGEVMPGEQGVPEVEILGKEFTSFLVLVGIYFPSVTGIMAGSNRSGDLKDPSRSIPRGTITAVITTSFIYLSNALLFGACIDGLLLRDKFGDSINKKLVISVLAWPNKWVITVGAFLSTFGAGLQSLTSAPRLLQAVSKDELIPFLTPLSKSFRGEPFRALLVTLFLCWCGILLGNVDYLTPLIAMFFLMCYGFINMACALQTLLRAPSWRPRYRFYHWSLSLLGLFLCLLIMFIVKWYYAIVAILLALIIYKYIEYKGAEKEWGDGIRGLSMSAARYALLRLEESPPHVKNWRPQILLLSKCALKSDSSQPQHNTLASQLSEPEHVLDDPHHPKDPLEHLIEIEHPNAFAFASQLKAGKGLFVCSSVIVGDFVEKKLMARACKSALRNTMRSYKAKGFCDTIVSQSVEQGICHMIQTEGLGGLRHNTIILNWPDKWNQDFLSNPKNAAAGSSSSEEESLSSSLSFASFVQTLRFAQINESATIITKGIDSWPTNSKKDAQQDTIDLWWIIHDGGLLLLVVFLLKKHKIWQKCKLRLFTVAQVDENSIQIKNDLIQYMYYLRIDAEVNVIEMSDGQISAYTYEKTLKLHEREKLLKQMKLKDAENEPQIVLERVRRNSVLKMSSTSDVQVGNEQQSDRKASVATSGSPSVLSEIKEQTTSFNNQYTFSSPSNSRRPSIFNSDTIRKMHSAVELNSKILEKSKDASLVLMNIPAPPKYSVNADFNYMAYISEATQGLKRVLLVHGSGREVITIFS